MNQAHHPLVSIIIPTKNSSRTIQACLQSCQDQTYAHIEIIVVDNFSTDGTDVLAKDYTDHVYHQGPERTAQKNYGIKEAKGEYMLLIDGDMILDKNLIDDCMTKIESNDKGGGVVIPVVDIGKSFWTKVIAFERSFYKDSDMEAARFLKSSLVREVGGYKHIIFYEEFIVPQEIGKLGYDVKIHSNYNLYHDYDDFTFMGNLKKKYYYGGSLRDYKKQMILMGLHDSQEKQISIVHRYMIFFKDKRFYKRPLLALGVLLLKTMEFGAGGLGLLMSKMSHI